MENKEKRLEKSEKERAKKVKKVRGGLRHLLSLKDYSEKEILETIKLAESVKKSPGKYKDVLHRKILLLIFSKPSLRTYLSFDIAMYKLGGHAIFYDLDQSTLGQKESIKDFSKVISRYADIVMARLYEHKDIEGLALNSSVPVINGLTNYFHPCQILGDFLTIKEKFKGKKLKDLRICYIGDGNNNITHSLIIGCNNLGMKLTVSCPDHEEYKPNSEIIGGTLYKYEKDPAKAIKGADIIYTDTWMSYHVEKGDEKRRIKTLSSFQINKELMSKNRKALFMHCLPAKRGQEVTDEIMDSEKSIVYDQAENRMWIEMAILLKLLGKA